jgi:hypothetical protein
LGRLWQTLILRNGKPLLAYLPVETVVRDRQAEYYRVLSAADRCADAAPFVEFMLQALCDAMREAMKIGQVTDQVTGQVALLINALSDTNLSASQLMKALAHSHRQTFRENYLNPALEQGWIERTQPDVPRSPTQRYRLSGKGKRWLQNHDEQISR